MSAISLPQIIGLLKVVKRLWFARKEQIRHPPNNQSTPPHVGKSCRRHSAFFKLP